MYRKSEQSNSGTERKGDRKKSAWIMVSEPYATADFLSSVGRMAVAWACVNQVTRHPLATHSVNRHSRTSDKCHPPPSSPRDTESIFKGYVLLNASQHRRSKKNSLSPFPWAWATQTEEPTFAIIRPRDWVTDSRPAKFCVSIEARGTSRLSIASVAYSQIDEE